MTTLSSLRRHLLTRLSLSLFAPLSALLPAVPAAAAPGGPRDKLPLLLAVDAAPEVDPAGFLVSEKLDGVRAFWDGHQLRTRSGITIAAPTWFLRRLPPQPLDGELWLGRGGFEALSGAVRRAQADDDEWRQLRYMVFELPFAPGPFARRAAALRDLVQAADMAALQAVPQLTVADRPSLQRWLDAVVGLGGEGLMLHRADAHYLTGRHAVLRKLKPVHDADAEVMAIVPGRGRHAGRMGALRVRTPEGHQFLLGSGFSDAERESPPAPGTWLTYRHRGRTDSGLPRFASYLRLRGA